MRSRVSFLMEADSRNARETVICEKPLASATSSIVGMARAGHDSVGFKAARFSEFCTAAFHILGMKISGLSPIGAPIVVH